MSIFQTIKYPISNPPTESELAALPSKTYRTWCTYIKKHISFIDKPHTGTMSFVMERLQTQNSKLYKEYHDLLKDLIFNIDEGTP